MYMVHPSLIPHQIYQLRSRVRLLHNPEALQLCPLLCNILDGDTAEAEEPCIAVQDVETGGHGDCEGEVQTQAEHVAEGFVVRDEAVTVEIEEGDVVFEYGAVSLGRHGWCRSEMLFVIKISAVVVSL